MALDLGKEIGPLPLGAWIVVVGGGLGIALYTRNSGSTSGPEIVTDTSGVPGVGEGGSGQWQAVGPGADGPTVADPRAAVVDNDTWAVYVMNVLIGRYNYDPLLVDSAIRKYINGSKLSASEYTIVREAIKLMVPPNPIQDNENTNPPPPTTVPGPVTTTPPPPVTKPPAPKPSARYYTVKKGDTLWGISKRYYGTGTKYMTIYNANRKGKKLPDGSVGKISTPGLIQPGWRLHIP